MEFATVSESFLRKTGGQTPFAKGKSEWNLKSALGRHAEKGECRETAGLQTIVIKIEPVGVEVSWKWMRPVPYVVHHIDEPDRD
jgi:hypothetical protein